MKKFIFLIIFILIPFLSKSQISGTWSYLDSLRTAHALIPNQIYFIQNMDSIMLRAKTNSSFNTKPVVRTAYALDYDEEFFDFPTKKISAIDNIDCVVRCVNSVWTVINDGTHIPRNIGYINSNIGLFYAKTYSKVLSFSTSIDETYVASNLAITCGASVSLNYALIYLYKTVIIDNKLVKVRLSLGEASISGSNIWVMGRLVKYIQL